MPVIAQATLFTTVLCFSVSALSTTVQRCEDSTGKLTFTYQGCPDGSSMRFQEAYNASPGTRISSVPEAESDQRTQNLPREKQLSNKELVVVGQHDDGCGNQITNEQRRKAIINQRIVGGMNMRDVESALGKPDKVVNRNGELRHSYAEKNGRSSQVVFNEDGCVKAKR